MSWLLILAVALAGGLGAVCRYVMTMMLGGYTSKHVAIATLCVNILASFLIGVLAIVALNSLVSPQLKTILGTGFLGGFSTFSTMMNENTAIAKVAKRSVLINLTAQCVLPIVAVVAGMAFAQMLVH